MYFYTNLSVIENMISVMMAVPVCGLGALILNHIIFKLVICIFQKLICDRKYDICDDGSASMWTWCPYIESHHL